VWKQLSHSPRSNVAAAARATELTRLTGIVLDDRGAPITGVRVSAPSGKADETTGYEPQNLAVRGPTEVIKLHDLVGLPVGESIRFTVGPIESVDLDWEYHYRRIRVASTTPTGVELSVTAADGNSPRWWLPPGLCCESPPSVVTSIDDVGTALVMYFYSPFGIARTYTLTTRRLGQ
jgi:hypothetical protein